MHLWRSQYNALIRYAQLKFCRRLIVVPLSTFYRLSEQIGDPKGELIFLFSTSRCGSNLVTQVLFLKCFSALLIKLLLYLALILVRELYLSKFFRYWSFYLYMHAKYWYLNLW